MTASAESPESVEELEGGSRSLGPRWRARIATAQEEVLPSGRVVVSCAASLGMAGLGRHMREIVDALDRSEQPNVCISRTAPGNPPTAGESPTARNPPTGGGSLRRSRDSPVAWPYRALRAPVIAPALAQLGRVSPTWRVWRARAEFDADAARQLPAADHLIAFNGQALAQFRAARRNHYKSVALVSGGVHVRRIARQHAAAHRDYPLERSHAKHVLKRYLLEYERADRIYVASRYTWESFAEEGIPESSLSLFPLTPDPRFTPGPAPHVADPVSRTQATFDIMYVGGLSVAKGVPLLIDAVRRLPHADLRLVLVGGWKSRGMRHFIEQACAEDPRISAAPGDPLPCLRAARLCVHPSYVDGFSYGAAEALACGVPVIVSEDTGMKDLIVPGRNGLILPTGDLSALTEAIEAAYRGEILDD